MADVEIGIGKSGRRAYGFDDIAIVPSRRTRDPEEVDIGWEIDAFRFELPVMASPSDSVVSPATAAELGRLGGVGVLHLEGLWTRYADPEPVLEEIAALPAEKATSRMQELYREPVQPDLVGQRIGELKAAGTRWRWRARPSARSAWRRTCCAAEPDLLVVQGTVVSAEHVVPPARAAQPQGLHPPLRDPGGRRRVHLVPGRPPPHAHRRRRGARGGRLRGGRHHPPGARASASRWPPPSPTPERRACATSTRPASTSTWSPTAA